MSKAYAVLRATSVLFGWFCAGFIFGTGIGSVILLLYFFAPIGQP